LALLGGAGVVALVALVVLVIVLMRDDASGGPDPDRVAELEAEEAERQAEQVVELTDLAFSIHDELLPVLEGMNEVLPVDGSASSRSADDDELSSWKAATDAAVGSFADPPSGSTGHNIARGGLQVSAELLASAVSAYELALDADGGHRAQLEELAADLRLQAVRTWSVAATQLDVLNIDAGHGHVHIYLPAEPGSGALAPDSHPEGSEGHDHDEDHG
jgi:hypothetical protein